MVIYLKRLVNSGSKLKFQNFVRFYSILHLNNKTDEMKRILPLLLVLCCTIKLFAQTSVKVNQISKSGTPLLFLPHIGCSSEMWNDIAAYYSKTHSCYLVDFAGFNGLSPVQPPYTSSYVEDLHQYIKSSHLENAILVGQNYGAFVAVKVAQSKDLKVKAIIAADFYPKLSMVIDTLMTHKKLTSIQESIRKVILEADTNSFTLNQKQTAEMMNFIDTTYVSRFINWQLRSDRKTIAETLCEQIAEDLMPALEQNTIPVLAVSTWYFASHYKHMPIGDAEKQLTRMYGKIPLVKHAVTVNAKDFIANDQPQWFIDEVNTFLKQYAPGK